jgi:RNA polymerase sigma-70 factor (ECF subfamily)
LTRAEYNIAVALHSGRLYGYVMKCLQDSEDANDIVQDAFEKLWNNRKKVDFEKAKSWLFTTAHNALINFAKKKSRVEFYDENLPDRIVMINNNFEIKEIVDMITDMLPQMQKSILLLRDMEGYNYKEIAELLNISEAQVKVYLFRARRKIKDNLTQFAKIHEIA